MNNGIEKDGAKKKIAFPSNYNMKSQGGHNEKENGR
jgi:hypothetical protein